MMLLAGQGSKKSCGSRSEEHTSELQSLRHLVCRLLLEKKTNALLVRWLSHWSGLARRRAGKRRPLAWPVQVHRGLLQRELRSVPPPQVLVFFFNDTATTEIYPLSLHDALPI